jgi:DNA invertase Pin-like site-specific DNA recombinase
MIAINMRVDLTTEAGKLLAMIAAAGGEYEWSRIQKRTQRNADYEKQHGLLKRACFGYRLKKGRAELDTAPFLSLLQPETFPRSAVRRQSHPRYQARCCPFNLTYPVGETTPSTT